MSFYYPEPSEEDNQGNNPVGDAFDSAQNIKDNIDSARGLKDFADKTHGAGKYAQSAAGKAPGLAGSFGGAGSAAAGSGAAAASGAAAGTAAGAGAGVAAGAGGGAALGATAGSVVPGAGTAAGAVIGTVVGSAASSKTGRKIILGGILAGCGCLASVIALPIIVVFMLVITILGGEADPAEASPQFLSINGSVTPNNIPKGNPGETASVSYSYSISNNSDKEALNLVVVNTFNGVYVNSVSAQESCDFTLGTLSPGVSTTVSCTVVVNKLDDDWLLTSTIGVIGTIDGQTQQAQKTLSVRIGNPPASDPSGWPTSGEITQTPFCTGGCISHSALAAVDIGAGAGVPVYATHDGQAFSPTYSASYGVYVLVEGQNYTTLYGHLQAVNSACVPGSVRAGALLGWIDSTGHSTGNHLHYEIRYSSGGQVSYNELTTLMPDWNVRFVTGSYSGNSCG